MTVLRYSDESVTIRCRECYGDAVETEARSGIYWCENCEQSVAPHVTDHALRERWATYTPTTVNSTVSEVLRAWRDGRPVVADPRDWSETDTAPFDIEDYIGHRFVGTELRYHAETNTSLLLRNTNIVTVIDMTTARLNAKLAVVQTLLADDVDTKTVRETMNKMEIDVESNDMSVKEILTEREKLRRAFVTKYKQQT